MKRINVVIALAAALFLSQTACSSGNQTNSTANTATQNSTANTNAPAQPPTPQNQNAGTQAIGNANTDNNPFSELVMLHSELFTARMKGNREKVASLLADDYKETTGDGKVLNKSQVLASISPDKKYESYTQDEFKSNVRGEAGVVTGRITVLNQGKTESWRFTENFRKQQGRWLAVSLKNTDYKK